MATRDEETSGSNFQKTAKDTLNTVKNFTATNFTRAKQMTIERMGKAEPTEFGTDFNDLCQELDKIKTSAETVLSHTIQMLEPNPG
jgi:hypothetical protein